MPIEDIVKDKELLKRATDHYLFHLEHMFDGKEMKAIYSPIMQDFLSTCLENIKKQITEIKLLKGKRVESLAERHSDLLRLIAECYNADLKKIHDQLSVMVPKPTNQFDNMKQMEKDIDDLKLLRSVIGPI